MWLVESGYNRSLSILSLQGEWNKLLINGLSGLCRYVSKLFIFRYLLDCLKDDRRAADRERTPGGAVSITLDWPQREVEVVGVLDDCSLLEGSCVSTERKRHKPKSSYELHDYLKLIDYNLTCMRHDGIGETVSPHVGVGIWGLGCPQPKK